MNIDFGTLYLISVPGFLVGIATGRFLAGRRWQALKKKAGPLGKLLSGLVFAIYLVANLITLAVMGIYLKSLPDAAPPRNYWITLLLAVWIIFNLILDCRDAFHVSKARDYA